MTEPEVPRYATPAERAAAFHKANPHVYRELRDLAFSLKRRGHDKFGIAICFEQMRWRWFQQTTDVSGFKLNNSYRAFYSRLLMANEPELLTVFETRRTNGVVVLENDKTKEQK